MNPGRITAGRRMPRQRQNGCHFGLNKGSALKIARVKGLHVDKYFRPLVAVADFERGQPSLPNQHKPSTR